MDKPIVAAIQHKLMISKSVEEQLAYYHRFLRIAKGKGSVLAVLPEFSGLSVGIPLFQGWRNSLLKEAAAPKTGFLPKLKSMLAGGAATVVRADLQKSLRTTLAQMPESLYESYISFFANLAREYGMTLVAGSLFHFDAETQEYRNSAYVFGPDGTLLGQQAQVILEPDTLDIVQPGPGWQVIDSPAGRIGILFGYETLYPEPARVLAYQGAEMLLTLAATKRPATYHKIKQAALARCQENQLYGLASFLVGPDPFATADEPLFMGKSAIFAPIDFTPRFTGVMIELGNAQAEGVITAEWDYPALHDLWATVETPIRRKMPLQQVDALARIYDQNLTLDAAHQLQLPDSNSPTPPLLTAEDLPEAPETADIALMPPPENLDAVEEAPDDAQDDQRPTPIKPLASAQQPTDATTSPPKQPPPSTL